jgi:hypothetical protein
MTAVATIRNALRRWELIMQGKQFMRREAMTFIGGRNRKFIFSVNALATLQFVWCYLWLTRPYVNTELYSQGRERMPFQGRCLMMPILWWAHQSSGLRWIMHSFNFSHFWFPKTVQPEVLAQAAVGVLCVGITGYFTSKIYEASSQRGILTPFVYPLVLGVCAATYIMHTVQNFRFIYDLPSLAFFSAAMYLLYFRRHWAFFVALFLVATINRETTLLLLPLYVINEGFDGSHFRWLRAMRPKTIAIILPLTAAWVGWELFVRHIFIHNHSEFYPRFNWNIKSLLAPLAWPQLLSACGYLLLCVSVMHKRIPDRRLRAWLWIVPIWLVFMFSYGILIETRVFGELIPLVVCSSCLIAEETIMLRLKHLKTAASLAIMGPRKQQTSEIATSKSA